MTESFRRHVLTLALCSLPAGTGAEYDRRAIALHNANRADPTGWPREREAWQGAIRLDPHDEIALHALLDLEIASVQFASMSAGGTAEHLGAAADAVLAQHPGDGRATVWRKVADLLSAAAKPGPPPPSIGTSRRSWPTPTS